VTNQRSTTTLQLCKNFAKTKAADAQSLTYNPKRWRYLDADIGKGICIAMANRIRLPRFSPQDFDCNSMTSQRDHIPCGNLVGFQIHWLHFNSEVYPNPFAFKPARWLNNPTPDTQRDWIPSELNARQCIARNLAIQDLFLTVRAIAGGKYWME
jgi:hypothetical protein